MKPTANRKRRPARRCVCGCGRILPGAPQQRRHPVCRAAFKREAARAWRRRTGGEVPPRPGASACPFCGLLGSHRDCAAVERLAAFVATKLAEIVARVQRAGGARTERMMRLKADLHAAGNALNALGPYRRPDQSPPP